MRKKVQRTKAKSEKAATPALITAVALLGAGLLGSFSRRVNVAVLHTVMRSGSGPVCDP
jgi:hypothetical protein